MNFGMADLLVDSHISDIQRQAGRLPAGAPGRRARQASGAAARARLRRWIGFALVEVGLHLQATAGAAGGKRPRAAE
jgi:hypothetical protein